MAGIILISVIVIGSVELLALIGVRKNYFSPWIAFIIVVIASSASGIYFVYSRGDSLLGALCLAPLLAFSFGIPTLLLSFALKRKDLAE
jgi:hypothetical protein